MTLIVALNAGDNFPVLIGDILISAERIPGIDAKILTPAAGQVAVRALNTTTTPISLSQKLYCVNDNIIVGYAGCSIAARSIMKSLRDEFQNRPAMPAEIQDFLDKIASDEDFPEALGVSIVGLCFILNGEVINFGYFHWRGERIIDPGLGPVSLAGSGSHLFLETMSGFQDIRKTGDMTPWSSGISKALSIMSTLMVLENSNHATLQSGFGGYYEIACLMPTDHGVGMRKFDGYLTLFWDIIQKDSELIEFKLTKSFKPKYIEDLLYIMEFKSDFYAEGDQDAYQKSIASSDILMHVVAPAFRGFRVSEIDEITSSLRSRTPDISADFVVNIIRKFTAEGNFLISVFVCYRHSGITFAKEDALQNLKFTQEFLEDLANSI